MGGDSANEPIGNVKYRGPTNLDELSNWLKNISSPKNYRNPTNMKELSDWLINYAPQSMFMDQNYHNYNNYLK